MQLDAYIEQSRQAWQVPGLAVAIVRGNDVLLSKGYGVRRVGDEAKVDQHTLFAIASNSKAFTAACLAMLVEDGKLNWDDRVQKYLPWLELHETYASHDLRVRDLLCHRSGLGTFSGDLLWYGTPYSPREILERARYLKPEGPFRAHYGYSNLMFLAAGEVIREVSGLSWSEFVQQRILDPLEMHRSITTVRDLVAKDNFATPHKTYLDRSNPIPWVNWDAMAAAGGIISSVDDMSLWMRMQLRQGNAATGRTLFSEASSREMWESHMPIRISARASQRSPTTHFKAYGLGWSLSDYQGKKIVAHGGGYDGMYSQVMMIPEEKIGVVVLTNSMTSISEPICFRVLDKLLQLPERDWCGEALPAFRKSREDFQARIDRAVEPVVKNTRPSHELSAYAGKFRCPLYGDATVTVENGGLVLQLLPNPAMIADLSHIHYDTFKIRWRNDFAWFEEGSAHFVADAKGNFVELKLDVPNDDLWFHELELKAVPK